MPVPAAVVRVVLRVENIVVTGLRASALEVDAPQAASFVAINGIIRVVLTAGIEAELPTIIGY